MEGLFSKLRANAENYCDENGLQIEDQLGYGQDGIIYSTKQPASMAVKAFEFPRTYSMERDIYLRFKECKVTSICGFTVPQLVGYDDNLMVVEMSVVSAPFVLDFAKCYLDRRPDFSAEVIAEWMAERYELFDADQWSTVLLVMAELEKMGVYSYDARPSNIAFLEDDS